MSADIFFGSLVSESATTTEHLFATGVDRDDTGEYHRIRKTKSRRVPVPTIDEEMPSSLNLWPALLRLSKTTDLISDGINSQRAHEHIPYMDPTPTQLNKKESVPALLNADITKRTSDLIVHTDHKAHAQSLSNNNSIKRQDSGSSDDSTLVDDPDTRQSSCEYTIRRRPILFSEWPDLHTAGKSLSRSPTTTPMTPPKSSSPEVIVSRPLLPAGRKHSNNQFEGLTEADLQSCAKSNHLANENNNDQVKNTVDHTKASLAEVFTSWRLPKTDPVELPEAPLVQHGIKNIVAPAHTSTAHAKTLRRRTVSFVETQEQPSNKPKAPVLRKKWYQRQTRSDSGPPHRPPVDARTVTITTMAQLEYLKKTVHSSSVVGLAVKEDSMTATMRHYSQFHYSILQVVGSSEPHTVFKLEAHRLENDAVSQKYIFTNYDVAKTRFIEPGSTTARLLSAHLIVLLEELLKNPSVVKIAYNWRYLTSSSNKVLASAFGSTTDHKNLIDLKQVGLSFTKINTTPQVIARDVAPSILHRNRASKRGNGHAHSHDHHGDEGDDEESDYREARCWYPDPAVKGNSRPAQTQDDRSSTMNPRGARPGLGKLVAWTPHPGVARIVYGGHMNASHLLAKITSKRLGPTHWAEELDLPPMSPEFRIKCQYADERVLHLLEVYYVLQKVRQLEG
ncbi:hypothetical protein CPB97_000894 [Podila verticillata]|nr:hypothetical protein CPB97_000894 [Podila verticillata]